MTEHRVSAHNLISALREEVDFFQRNRLRGEKSSTESLLLEAADRIALLEKALEPFAHAGEVWVGPWSEIIIKCVDSSLLTAGDLRRARNALAEIAASLPEPSPTARPSNPITREIEMTDNQAVADIARELSKQQRDVLIAAARFLDTAAGEGVGMRSQDDPDIMCFADDIVTAACAAFGLTMEDAEAPFAAAVRAHLEGTTDVDQ